MPPRKARFFLPSVWSMPNEASSSAGGAAERESVSDVSTSVWSDRSSVGRSEG
jgi:hypothetical protein